MLKLDRKVDQKIFISQGEIKIKVLRIDEGIITLGFLAPRNIEIDREELFVKKQSKRLMQNK